MSLRDDDKILETSTGELRLNCMFCKQKGKSEDTGYHLYVNKKKGLYFCHRCESKGAADALKQFIHDIDSAKDPRDVVEQARNNNTLPKPERKYFNLDFIGSPPVEGAPSWAYLLKERNLSPKEIRYYDIRSGTSDMRGRIVIPVFDKDGYCIYYSGRTYTGRNPKYKNPDVDKKNVVFNLHSVETEHVIVCEGMFSAIHAGKSAVAVLGKYLSNWQINAIGGRFKKVYLAFDGDVHREDENLPRAKRKIPMVRNRFQKLGCSVGVVPLPGKDDPEDVGREEFQRLVAETELKANSSANPVIRVPMRERFYSKE